MKRINILKFILFSFFVIGIFLLNEDSKALSTNIINNDQYTFSDNGDSMYSFDQNNLYTANLVDENFIDFKNSFSKKYRLDSNFMRMILLIGYLIIVVFIAFKSGLIKSSK